MNQLDEVKAVVLALTALDSLLDAGPLSNAWKAEIERRSREIDTGAAELIENDEVFARVRARL